MERQQTEQPHNIEERTKRIATIWHQDFRFTFWLLDTTVIKALLYWQNNKQIDQWNKLESPEIDSHKYCQQLLDKREKSHDGVKRGFSADGAGTTEPSQMCKWTMAQTLCLSQKLTQNES